MKYLIAVLVIAFSSCTDPITFDIPQPENTNNLTSIPEKLSGNYLSSDKCSIVSIDSNSIIRIYDYDEKELKDSLVSSYVLKGDTLFSKQSENKIKVVIKGDTILRHIRFTDTIFSLKDSNIIRAFKGYYFLNTQRSQNAWVVQKLSLQNGILTIGQIEDRIGLKTLQEITNTENDTVSLPFSLTQKQFKKFLHKDGFSKEERFTRITLFQ